MHIPSSHINDKSYHEFYQWDPPFMWKEGVCIYGTPGVHNNFSFVRESLVSVGAQLMWEYLYIPYLNLPKLLVKSSFITYRCRLLLNHSNL